MRHGQLTPDMFETAIHERLALVDPTIAESLGKLRFLTGSARAWRLHIYYLRANLR